MFDAWTGLATIGGTGALSYLAAGGKTAGDEATLRLSLDKGGSLLGDVRLLGGVLTLLGSYWLKGEAVRKTLGVITVASFGSLLSTELIRVRLRGRAGVAARLPFAPSIAYGNQGARDRQGSWAAR
jgi:hypothetical protein